jgi:hypothetical protein
MDSCGSQMLGRQKENCNDKSAYRERLRIFRGSMLCKMLCLFFMAVQLGCATTVKYGSPPRVNQLGVLKPNQSNKDDVLTALGEPRGHGAVNLSVYPRRGEIWFYEYGESEQSRISLKFLIVFFDKDIYVGHLWFSSAQLMDTAD